MKPIKAYIYIIVLSFIVGKAWGQSRHQIILPHFNLTAEGAYSEKKTDLETDIAVVGGFIQIRLTSLASAELTTRTYFSKDQNGGDKLTKNNISNQVFLRTGDTFSVDILKRKTDQLIHRYNIKRIVKIPQLQILFTENGKIRDLTPQDGMEAGEIKTTNAKSIQLGNIDSSTTLDIEYRLINLNTKKTEDNSTLKGTSVLKLNPNTEYELRYNYTLQPESVQIIYIKNKGEWYQDTNSYIAIGVILIAIIVTLILKNMTNKVRISASELKKMESSAIRLQSMLNPHFTFNALSTVQGLMNTGRIDEANLYLENFGNLLRQSLAKSQTLYHSLDQELEMMRMYLSIESLRFSFEWELDIENHLPLTEIEVPTLLMQPLIENAIKHGLKNVEKGKIILSCKSQGDTLIITVQDNGKWASNPTGYGLKNTQERIATINKMRNNQPIVLDFDLTYGTAAKLTFFNWLKYD